MTTLRIVAHNDRPAGASNYHLAAKNREFARVLRRLDTHWLRQRYTALLQTQHLTGREQVGLYAIGDELRRREALS